MSASPAGSWPVRAIKTLGKVNANLARWLAVAFLIVWELALLGVGIHLVFGAATGKTALSESSGQPVGAGGYVFLAVVWLILMALGVLLFLVVRRIARAPKPQLDALHGEPSDGASTATPGKGDASGDE